MTSGNRKVLLFALTANVLVIIVVIYIMPKTVPHLRTLLTSSDEQDDKDKPLCVLPHMDPFDPSLKKIISVSTERLQCHQNPTITFQNGTRLMVNKTAVKLNYGGVLNCTYQAITRPESGPDTFRYKAEKMNFSGDVEVKDEFVRVTCYNKTGIIYRNFHAFVIPNKRLEDLENRQNNQRKKSKELPNVLLLGMDSVSRLNFHRQMRQTKQLLDELNAIELELYNKVGMNTFPNMAVMTTGKFITELPWKRNISGDTFDKCNFIWNDYREKGYVTMFAEDAPNMATFNYLKSGFKKAPTDYYYRPFSLAMEREKLVWNSGHHCVNDRPETGILLDYIRHFSNEFVGRPHFSLSFISRLSHNSLNGIHRLDHLYFNFLDGLRKDKKLESTIVFFFSDHGFRWGSIYSTFIGRLESKLPFFYMLFPKWFLQKNSQSVNLYRNARKLTSPFDVYQTLRDILQYNETIENKTFSLTRGQSLFDLIPNNRSCESAGIPSEFCVCLNLVDLPKNDAIAQKVAIAFVQYINDQTKEYAQCVRLSLLEIQLVSKVRDDSGNQQQKGTNITKKMIHTLTDYRITIKTKPGSAIFQANLKHMAIEGHDNFVVTGSVARLDRYGEKVNCLKNRHQKFCHCR